MKKYRMTALSVSLALLLTGCSAILEGESSTSAPHGPVIPVTETAGAERTLEVKDREGLMETLMDLVEDHVSYARLQFSAYEGDPGQDLADTCMRIPNETPLGAWGVYYINYTLNMIVARYEADVTITYKQTAESFAALEELADLDVFSRELRDAALEHRPGGVFLLPERPQAAQLEELLDEVYYATPELLYRPEMTLSLYPESGDSCVAELSLSYPYSRQTTENRLALCEESAAQLMAAARDAEGNDELLRALARALAASATFDAEREALDDYSRWYNIYTSYGALVLNRCVGEGFAMAMQLLCEEADLECAVVRGRLNNVSHAWNIVRLENGSLYHLDVSLLASQATAEAPEADPSAEDGTDGESPEPGDIFYTDSELSVRYWWDTTAYPACDGESLQPEPLPEPEPIVPSVEGHIGTAPGPLPLPAPEKEPAEAPPEGELPQDVTGEEPMENTESAPEEEPAPSGEEPVPAEGESGEEASLEGSPNADAASAETAEPDAPTGEAESAAP